MTENCKEHLIWYNNWYFTHILRIRYHKTVTVIYSPVFFFFFFVSIDLYTCRRIKCTQCNAVSSFPNSDKNYRKLTNDSTENETACSWLVDIKDNGWFITHLLNMPHLDKKVNKVVDFYDIIIRFYWHVWWINILTNN